MISNSFTLRAAIDGKPKLLLCIAAFGFVLGALTTQPTQAASPSSATITASSTPIPFVTTATGGASSGESTCVEGTNCDTFTLTVGGAVSDYAGKIVKLNFSWTLPASDYDFYIHKGTLTGPIVATGANDGAPATTDQAALDPGKDGVGAYVVHIVYFSAAAADQCHGVASIAAANTALRTATYINTGITFSPNVPLKCPVTVRDGEPSSRTDFMGNCYVGGIRGFPAGVDLWYFDLNPTSATYDPNMRVPLYRGQPDAFSPSSVADLGGDGGGDIDLAVGFSIASGKTVPTLAFSSLIAANISSGQSFDLAKTYSKNPAGNVTGGVAADDRQWEEFLGSMSVYLLYRTLAPAVTQIQRSNDGGFSFGPASTVGAIGQVGPIDVHQATGTVFAPGSTGVMGVGQPATATGEPLSTDYKVRTAADDPNGVAHLFFVTKVADDGTAKGTVYACYSNDKDIFLKSSKDQGITWTDPVKVNNPAGPTKVNLFPWMETGPIPGSVGVVWYGTTASANDDTAQWKVYFAQSFNADTATPSFSIAEVTEPEHVIHAANISEGGLTGTANRNLLDYFQVSFDPSGAAAIAYTDDHNDYDGATYVARQISGPSIRGGVLTAPAEGSGLKIPLNTPVGTDVFPPIQPGLNGEQVTDFERDVENGLLVRVGTADPFDISTARYDTSGTADSLAIAVSIRVTDLSTIPPSGTWQAAFAVNAPHSSLGSTGTYTNGASDRGDQFFLQADTDASGVPTYSYGTAVRNSDGSLTYTSKGAADTGAFNQVDNTISIQVNVAKLNAALAAGHTAITNSTVVTGLRATAKTSASGDGRRDLTRGGTQFVVHDSAFPYPAGAPAPTPLPAASPLPSATPPTIELANISTRVSVQPGNGVGIGGFIIRTISPKRLIIRGIGPSLQGIVSGTVLADPVLEIRNLAGTLIASNDDWRVGGQQAEITASGLAPTRDTEAAVIVNLPGGNYTATLRGKNNGTGIGLVEVYDIGAESRADLGNIATRGLVQTGNDILIGGFIVRDDSSLNQPQRILIRGIGPSLPTTSVPNPLQDPTIELHDGQGALLVANDDWQSSPDAAAIQLTTIAPTNPKESAILRTLAPGNYTAVMRGANGGRGIGLVEIYNLGNQ